MEKFPIGRPKDTTELKKSVKNVSEFLGHEIVQPFLSEDIFKMPISEIKARFPLRYEMYLKILQFEHKMNEMDEEEIEKMKLWLGALNNLDLYIEENKDKKSEHEGREAQEERQATVFEDMRNFLEQGGKKGYVKLPTGSGKTVIFVKFIDALRLKTIIAEPKRLLVDQTKKELSKFASNIEAGLVYTHEKDYEKEVTITTYQSLVPMVKEGKINPKDYHLLILDEVHRALTTQRTESIDQFEDAVQIGFTATTEYHDEKKVSGECIHELSVKEATEEGILSPFRIIVLKTGVDISNVGTVGFGDKKEYKKDELAKEINVHGRNIKAVEMYQQAFKDKTAVAYCASISHAENVALLFNEAGIYASSISSKDSRSKQAEILQKYKSGEIKVLCNADLLIEGFDEAKASVCFNLRPTMSMIVAEQRAGRVLRLDMDNPKKFAYVIDFLDENENAQNTPITFAQIVSQAEVRPRKTKERTNGNMTNEVTEEKQFDEIDFSNLKIEGVVSNVVEVMDIVKKNIDLKYEEAPEGEGWITASKLSVEIDVNYLAIKSFAEQWKNDPLNEHSEWFKEYKNKVGQTVEYYHPDFIEIIKKHFEDKRNKQN